MVGATVLALLSCAEAIGALVATSPNAMVILAQILP